ncbi:MAG TPA: hypothetical protein VFE82_11940 [Ramlibacter sp.]|jgi:hypothetical protein|uniref:hypothetical protein n=1 Tax=Ramlibacter sp. TaxID=1917967 RepID=UPI002D5E62B1|nr:hypothetical protein [Ramlibacter sp.]HZY19184.1 hypothetical protein [Ramlibacter sp.]
MYAPPDDRHHPLLAQLARIGAARPATSGPSFEGQLAAARAQSLQALPRSGAAAAGLTRSSRLRSLEFS